MCCSHVIQGIDTKNINALIWSVCPDMTCYKGLIASREMKILIPPRI